MFFCNGERLHIYNSRHHRISANYHLSLQPLLAQMLKLNKANSSPCSLAVKVPTLEPNLRSRTLWQSGLRKSKYFKNICFDNFRHFFNDELRVLLPESETECNFFEEEEAEAQDGAGSSEASYASAFTWFTKTGTIKPFKMSSSAWTRPIGASDIGKSKSCETLKSLLEEDNCGSISMNEASSYASSESPKERPGLSLEVLCLLTNYKKSSQ